MFCSLSLCSTHNPKFVTQKHLHFRHTIIYININNDYGTEINIIIISTVAFQDAPGVSALSIAMSSISQNTTTWLMKKVYSSVAIEHHDDFVPAFTLCSAIMHRARSSVTVLQMQRLKVLQLIYSLPLDTPQRLLFSPMMTTSTCSPIPTAPKSMEPSVPLHASLVNNFDIHEQTGAIW